MPARRRVDSTCNHDRPARACSSTIGSPARRRSPFLACLRDPQRYASRWMATSRGRPRSASARASRRESPRRWRENRFNECCSGFGERDGVSRHGGRRAGHRARRSRLQHEHDRLSGSADRSVLRRTDRHDDLAADRQLRRGARRCRIGGAEGRRLHHARGVAHRQQLALRRARSAITSSPTTSSRSPTSTRES